MVLALMYGSYQEGQKPRYPKAYELAESQHNLNVWTFDKAIIGTNYGSWQVANHEDDVEPDISTFISNVGSLEQGTCSLEKNVKLGDFSVFSDFLKRAIGAHEELSRDW